jgi:hypothetical protein
VGQDTITTGVDELLAYLQGKDRVALQDTATYLNVPLDTLQAWVDFLVEEKILGIEYKFTKPYIYLNREEKPHHKKILEKTAVPLPTIRSEFYDRAIAKQIPKSKVPELWRSHVETALASKKAYFLEQAGRRKVENPEHVWDAYEQDLLMRSMDGA